MFSIFAASSRRISEPVYSDLVARTLNFIGKTRRKSSVSNRPPVASHRTERRSCRHFFALACHRNKTANHALKNLSWEASYFIIYFINFFKFYKNVLWSHYKFKLTAWLIIEEAKKYKKLDTVILEEFFHFKNKLFLDKIFHYKNFIEINF